MVIGAVVLLACSAVALFLVFGDSDENTESAGIPNEDISDLVSKMDRIASAADMECNLLEGEEKRESIGEIDDTLEFGNEEFYDLMKEAFEDSILFECERGDWEYDAWYPAERHLAIFQTAFEDPVKYNAFSDDQAQVLRDNAEEIRENCMDDSKRAEINEELSAGVLSKFLLVVDGFVFSIPYSPDREDFKDVMRENGFEAEDPKLDVDFCNTVEKIIGG